MSEWRFIPGWPYWASSEGEVIYKGRAQRRRREPKPLSQYKSPSGYLYVVLSNDGLRRRVPVHVVVCESFHGPRPDGAEVRHLNGKRDDNRAANLCWGTRAENASDRVRHGTDWNGDKHKNRVLSEEIVLDVRKRYAAGGVTFQSLADELGVDLGTVHKAVRGISWKSVCAVGEARGRCYE